VFTPLLLMEEPVLGQTGTSSEWGPCGWAGPLPWEFDPPNHPARDTLFSACFMEEETEAQRQRAHLASYASTDP
jgi:hypothetical protein